MIQITAADGAVLEDVLETVLADPDFIDTTSGGGCTEQQAEQMRDDLRRIQRVLGAQLVPARYDAAYASWRTACGHQEPVPGCQACNTYLEAAEAFRTALRVQNAADAAEGWEYPEPLQAVCTVCGQYFIPTDDSDLIHLETTVPPGVRWGDPTTYGVRLGELSEADIAALADALAGADSTAEARQVIADYSPDMPDEGPERPCYGRGEMVTER